jgi:hypothetical protein
MSGVITATGGICALVAGLAIIDERVRGQLASMVTNRPAASSELASVGDRLQDFLFVATQAVTDQSIEHAPLVIFALAALVLVLFMTRT